MYQFAALTNEKKPVKKNSSSSQKSGSRQDKNDNLKEEMEAIIKDRET